MAVFPSEMAVFVPTTVSIDVRNVDGLPVVGGRTTGAGGRADLKAIDGAVVAVRQAGSSHVTEPLTVIVQQ